MTDFYLTGNLQLENEKGITLTEAYFANNIVVALDNLFGEVGAAIPFHILKFSAKTKHFVLSCPVDKAAKFQAALTLQGTFQGKACAYLISRTGTDLYQLTEPQDS